METAKLFNNGQSQAVRLPKEYRFTGTEVGIKKVGGMVILFQKEKALDNFLSTEPISDDFAEVIFSAKRETYPDSPREQL